MNEPVSITVSGDDPRLVKLRGEVDMASAPALADALRDAPGDIELDCTGLDFIDSSGISILVAAHQALEATGSRLTIHNLPKSSRRVFQLTGIDEFLHLQ